jgi:hypothetical protein
VSVIAAVPFFYIRCARLKAFPQDIEHSVNQCKSVSEKTVVEKIVLGETVRLPVFPPSGAGGYF